ncbi:MAG: hypothetical protein GY832_05095, partial [Chloroflexi bacterium]|nr:hypothetical protein [Chloroflexota bacterium]
MLFYNLIGSVLHRVLTYVLILAMTGTSSIPIIRELPRATAAYLGIMEQLGLLKSDSTSPAGVSSSVPEEMKNEMGGMMPTIGEDGEPVGFLLNTDALEMTEEDFAPSAIANPISVSRVQSTYAATDAISNTLIITFTVTNNQSPAFTLSELSVTNTITNPIDVLSAMNFYSDSNVIRNVLLADEILPPNAIFVSADPMPDQAGDGNSNLVWNLGDILPLSSVTATLQIQIPASVADFTDLDVGATAWGTLQKRMISASAVPATLAPDTIDGESAGDWLIWTVDADYYDEYMVQKAAELGNDWQQMFSYVRSLGYESYKGSLRGTRGTLWSEAGNSLDQASLLIAMLRGSGIPARYRHGTLSTERAQELILSMFPEPQGTIGHIPNGTEVADPVNNSQLLEETIDHWWVEAYLPTLGWTNLVPCIVSAAPGQTFHDSLATDGTDQIAEVPDNLRHKVTMTVKVERWDMLSSLSGGLDYVYPLTHTFNTVGLVGEPVTLGHLVNSNGMGGMIFWRVLHTYTPYFSVGAFETLIEGQSFQDLVSNFPFGNFITTGEWLLFEVKDANGNIEQYEREVVDLIGYENRQAGGILDISKDIGIAPMITELDMLSVLVGPCRTPESAFNQYNYAWLSTYQESISFYNVSNTSSIDYSTPEEVQDARQLANLTREMILHWNALILLTFTESNDNFVSALGDGMLIRGYSDHSRLLLANLRIQQIEDNSAVRVQSLDLLDNSYRTIVAPDQATAVQPAFHFLAGFMASVLEGLAVESWANQQVLSTYQVFQHASEQDVGLQGLGISNAAILRDLDISDEAKARISRDIEAGYVVIVPEQMVSVGDEQTLGWFRVDPGSGDTIGVLQNGKHGAYAYSPIAQHGSLSYAKRFVIAMQVTMVQAAGWGFLGALVTTFVGEILEAKFGAAGAVCAGCVGQLLPFAGGIGAKLTMDVKEIADQVRELIMVAESTPELFFFAGMAAAVVIPFAIGVAAGIAAGYLLAGGLASLLEGRTKFDPPLPNCLFNLQVVELVTSTQSVLISQKGLYNNVTLTVALESTLTSIERVGSITWDISSNNDSIFEFIKLSSNDTILLQQPDETQLNEGIVRVIPFYFTATAFTRDASGQIAAFGSSKNSFYAPAVLGLGVGNDWLTYTATLTSTQPYTLTLQDAIVTVNDTDTYTGNFTLVVTGTTTLEGSGHTAAPNFADSAAIQATDADLQLGPATLLDGSLPFDASNGFALSGYTGPITITEHSPTLDRVELNGDFGQSLALSLDPITSTISPVEATTFDALISSNLTDTYTVTVEGPPGWDVEIDASGAVAATPPLGATPGDYTILVTAQSATNPALLVSAEHIVTTADHQGMEMDVALDPRITMPFGPTPPSLGGAGGGSLPGETNTGQAQLPGAAFTVDVTN